MMVPRLLCPSIAWKVIAWPTAGLRALKLCWAVRTWHSATRNPVPARRSPITRRWCVETGRCAVDFDPVIAIDDRGAGCEGCGR